MPPRSKKPKPRNDAERAEKKRRETEALARQKEEAGKAFDIQAVQAGKVPDPSQTFQGTRVFSRPEGAPFSQATALSGLSPAEAQAVQRRNFLTGLRETNPAQFFKLSSPEERQDVGLLSEEKRALQEKALAEEAELTRAIESPEELKPEESFGKVVAESAVGIAGETTGLAQLQEAPQFLGKLFTGKATQADINRQAEGVVRRFAAAGTIAGTLFASPIVAAKVASVSQTAGVAKVSGSLFTAGGGFIGAMAGAGGITGITTDVGRNEIDTMRASLNEVSGTSSTILSNVKNGVDAETGLNDLIRLGDSVDYAESAIKQRAVYNFKYRRSKEYTEDMLAIQDARQNIRERVAGVRQIALTGRQEVNPEALVLGLS